MAAVNVLITGANRGLGRGFVEAYLARPHHVVVAATRDPGHHTSRALAEITNKGEGSRLIVAKIDVTAEHDATAAVEHLKAQEGIEHLDIVIANAGVAYTMSSVADLKAEDLLAHFRPNVLGVVYLYQATRQLLLKAADPKWVTIGSNAGCIEASILVIALLFNKVESLTSRATYSKKHCSLYFFLFRSWVLASAIAWKWKEATD